MGGNPRWSSTLGSWSPTEANPRSDADDEGPANRLETALPRFKSDMVVVVVDKRKVIFNDAVVAMSAMVLIGVFGWSDGWHQELDEEKKNGSQSFVREKKKFKPAKFHAKDTP